MLVGPDGGVTKAELEQPQQAAAGWGWNKQPPPPVSGMMNGFMPPGGGGVQWQQVRWLKYWGHAWQHIF